MRRRNRMSIRPLAKFGGCVTLCMAMACTGASAPIGDQGAAEGSDKTGEPDSVRQAALAMIREGRHTFRFDTFGDEAFWGDTLRLHQAIAGAATGGVGPGVSPAAALGLGLKVDVEALPRELRVAIRNGQVDLNDPATTVALLRLNAVVGVTGFFAGDGTLRSMGIQC